MNREPLQFNPLFHNGAISFIENKWKRILNDHERHLVAISYDYLRTAHEVEEIKIIDDLHKNNQ